MQTPPKYRTVLLRCARLMSDELNHVLTPFQLNYSLWQVIYLLNERAECTSIELAQYLNVSKPSIAKRVNALEKLAFIEQVTTEDKRQKKLKLSHTGQNIFSQCSQQIDHYEINLLQPIDAEQLDQSYQVIQYILNQLESRKLEINHE